MPEPGRGLLEFDAHLRAPGLRRADVNDSAVQRLFGRRVRDSYGLPRDHLRHQRDQRPMRVHHQRARLFLEILSRSILAGHGDRHAQQDAHAAPASGIGNPVLFLCFRRTGKRHNTPTIVVPAAQGNRTKVQAVPKSYATYASYYQRLTPITGQLAPQGTSFARAFLNQSTGVDAAAVVRRFSLPLRFFLDFLCGRGVSGALAHPLSSGRSCLSPASRSASRSSYRPPASRA